MCVCLCVLVHVCVSLYICLCGLTWRDEHTCVRACMCIPVCMCASVYMCAHMYAYVCFSVYLSMCILTWKSELFMCGGVCEGHVFLYYSSNSFCETEPLIEPGAHRLARTPVLQAPGSSCPISQHIYLSLHLACYGF